MSRFQYTYYVIILGGSQGDNYLDYTGGGGPELGKSWLHDLCMLPNHLLTESSWPDPSQPNPEKFPDALPCFQLQVYKIYEVLNIVG